MFLIFTADFKFNFCVEFLIPGASDYGRLASYTQQLQSISVNHSPNPNPNPNLTNPALGVQGYFSPEFLIPGASDYARLALYTQQLHSISVNHSPNPNTNPNPTPTEVCWVYKATSPQNSSYQVLQITVD